MNPDGVVRDRPWLPLAAALVSVTLWASAFVGIRAAGRAFSPGALALGRLTLGSLLLGGLVLTRPFTRPSRRDAGLLLIALLADRARLFRQVPFDKPPQELTYGARGLIQQLGITAPALAQSDQPPMILW